MGSVSIAIAAEELIMIECRFYGRGGQGALTACDIMVAALGCEGKYGQGFPFFAGERRGAPMNTYLRIDDKPIRRREQIYSPDVVCVLDSKLADNKIWYQGLKQGGIAVLNTRRSFESFSLPIELSKFGSLDATQLAIDTFGPTAIPITNTSMLGALAKTTGIVKLDSLLEAFRHKFSGRMVESNVEAARAAYEKTLVISF